MAGSFAKGMFWGDKIKGSGVAGTVGNLAGKGMSLAGPVMSSMPSANAGPSVDLPFMAKSSAAKDALSKYAFKLTDGIDAAAYAAMIGAKFVPPENKWHHILDAAGLAALGGTTAYGMATDPHERKPGAKDLIGLALMGSALYDRFGGHHDNPGQKLLLNATNSPNL